MSWGVRVPYGHHAGTMRACAFSARVFAGPMVCVKWHPYANCFPVSCAKHDLTPDTYTTFFFNVYTLEMISKLLVI